MSEEENSFERPFVTTDTICIRYFEGELQLLLIQRKNRPFQGSWALPGGFVEEEETLRESAVRELTEETGVTPEEVTQFKTYGNPGRDPRGRVVTICFLAVLPPEEIALEADTDAAFVSWHSLRELPDLAFDHDLIARDVRREIRRRLSSTDLVFELVGNPFDLNTVFTLLSRETDHPLEPDVKMWSDLPFLKNVTEKKDGGEHADQYLFKKEKFSDWVAGRTCWFPTKRDG